jgi:hypothetical protein
MYTFCEITATTPGLNGSDETVGSVPTATNDSWTDGVGTGVAVGAAVGTTTTGVGVAVGAGVAVAIGADAESDGMDAVAGGVLDGAGPEGVAVARVAAEATASTSEPIPMAATTRPASPRASKPRGRLVNAILMVSLDPLRRLILLSRSGPAGRELSEIGP